MSYKHGQVLKDACFALHADRKCKVDWLSGLFFYISELQFQSSHKKGNCQYSHWTAT